MMPVDKVNECAAQFVADYILRKATQPSVLFRIGVLLGSPRAARLLDDETLRGLRALGVAEGDDVDVELLRKAVDSGMQKAGTLRVDALGVSLDAADVKAFFQLLETGRLP